MENLACYIIRASFSQERMQYLDQEGKVVYTAIDGRTSKSFLTLVRCYGHYSNVSRGKRQKEGRDEAIPCILESQGDEKTFRRNGAPGNLS